MANETEEKKYKIWIRRSDTHERIVDENIWVGNVHIPADRPYCKQSSGKTSGEEYAYVEFTWKELLKAVGAGEETVDITLDGRLEQTDVREEVPVTLDGELVQG